MPAKIQRINADTYVLNLSGVVQLSEFEKVLESISPDLGLGVQPRIFAILRDFEGWESGAEWGDLAISFSGESHEIAKIVIVGDPQWEGEALAFAGAGFRRAPVKFFPKGQEAEARTWLEA
ncbi:MAG: STAS/SEC14 domain-containing protein [Chthoniobacteraceae bacterium]